MIDPLAIYGTVLTLSAGLITTIEVSLTTEKAEAVDSFFQRFLRTDEKSLHPSHLGSLVVVLASTLIAMGAFLLWAETRQSGEASFNPDATVLSTLWFLATTSLGVIIWFLVFKFVDRVAERKSASLPVRWLLMLLVAYSVGIGAFVAVALVNPLSIEASQKLLGVSFGAVMALVGVVAAVYLRPLIAHQRPNVLYRIAAPLFVAGQAVLLFGMFG